jgi:hypothetical protein
MVLTNFMNKKNRAIAFCAQNFACVTPKLRQTVTTETTGERSMAFRYLATGAVFLFIGAIVIGLL